jgi:hypothetical protein
MLVKQRLPLRQDADLIIKQAIAAAGRVWPLFDHRVRQPEQRSGWSG